MEVVLPTVAPTTQLPSYCNSSNILVISNDEDCYKLSDNETEWSSISIERGKCNNMLDLSLSNHICLQSIVVKKGSLKNLDTLIISNNPELKTIVIEDGDELWSSDVNHQAPFENVKNVEFSSPY